MGGGDKSGGQAVFQSLRVADGVHRGAGEQGARVIHRDGGETGTANLNAGQVVFHIVIIHAENFIGFAIVCDDLGTGNAVEHMPVGHSRTVGA